MNSINSIALTARKHVAPNLRSNVVDHVAEEIHRIVECSAKDLALRVGELIVRHFYNGNLAAWRARGQSDPTFRSLVQRTDLPISGSSIYRSVVVYEIVTRFHGQAFIDALSSTHLAAVAGLESEQQFDLLTRAADDGWSSRRLKLEISQARRRNRRKGGRPAIPHALKATRRVFRELDTLDQRSLTELDQTERQHLSNRLQETLQRLSQILCTLGLESEQESPARRLMLHRGVAPDSPDAGPPAVAKEVGIG